MENIDSVQFKLLSSNITHQFHWKDFQVLNIL